MDAGYIADMATISSQGAILLGKYAVCDGFDDGREIAVITHAHKDHIGHLERCLSNYYHVLCTPSTREMLICLRGKWLERRRNLIPLLFNTPYEYKGEQITLYPTQHILGSCQVLVIDERGTRLVYTNDFDLPGTEPLKCDVLVTEATYGSPENTAKHTKQELIKELISIVDTEVKSRPICILGNRGKIPEIMSILRQAGLEIPFICEDDVYEMNSAYVAAGIELGNVISLRDAEAKDIMSGGNPHIVYVVIGRSLSFLPQPIKYTKIKVSRWGTTESLYKIDDDYWVIALSDHADYKGLLDYVRRSQPKLVVTDNYRGGEAVALAEAIRNELGIEAKPMP